MDFHALQHKLFEMDPSDPRDDLRKLQAQAHGGAADVPPAKDYVAESVEVPQGSMPLGLDSIADFAALAGVTINETQKMGSAGQAKGRDSMPRTSTPSLKTGEQPHPLKDKLVGEDENTEQNPELDGLIKKFVEKGMPEKAARMFAQIAYMHFNDNQQDVYPPRGDMEMDPSNMRQKESTTESIKERLLAALNDFK